jgi:hypothetical protein
MNKLLPALLLLGSGLFAQGPGHGRPGPPDHVAMMSTLLSLSEGQKAHATAVYANARTAEKGIQASMRTAQTALNAAVKKNDIAAIDTLTAQIGSLHAQSLAAQSKAEAAFYSNLTAEQQAKYDTLHRGGFGGGPRGPGFGGPGDNVRPPRPPQQ